MAEKFQCKICGNCCRNMRGRTTAKKSPEVPILFDIIPVAQKTVLLFEWEIPVLQKRAKQIAVEFRAKPDAMFWDELSNTPVVLQWNLDHDDCPFLSKENKCLAQEQKPLACQAFPLMAFGLMNTVTQKEMAPPLMINVMDCPNAVELPFEIDRKIAIKGSTFIEQLCKSYGNTFVGMLRLDAAVKYLYDSMKDLTEKWMIYPGIVDEDLKRVFLEAKNPVGYLEHLKRKYPKVEESLRVAIRENYKLDGASLERMIAQRRRKKKSNT